MAQHQQRRHALAQVVLGDEGFQHLLFRAARGRWHGGIGLVIDHHRRGLVHVRREVGAVAQVAAAAHHRQVDAGAPAGHAHRQDVDIAVAGRQAALVHRLLVQHARQRADAVAPFGRLLVVQRLGAGRHLPLQLVDHLLRLAEQKGFSIAHVQRVIGLRHQADAGPGAAADLVQQTGPRAVGEDRVLAGAQAEHLLDQVDRLLHRPGARVGAEVAVPAVDAAAVVGDAREASRLRRGEALAAAGDLQVGVALVVAEQDVELGVQRLDQVVLEQQRLGLGAHHGRFQPRDARHHMADARAAVVLVEVAGHALLQVARLADVQHLVARVEVAVHAGQAGQRRHLGEQAFAPSVGGGGGRFHRRGFCGLR